MFNILRVTGDSLRPEYQEGDFVLIAKIPFLFPVGVGDVIVFQRPPTGMIIKRVEKVLEEGRSFWVVGTHPESTDSRQLGRSPGRMSSVR